MPRPSSRKQAPRTPPSFAHPRPPLLASEDREDDGKAHSRRLPRRFAIRGPVPGEHGTPQGYSGGLAAAVTHPRRPPGIAGRTIKNANNGQTGRGHRFVSPTVNHDTGTRSDGT